MKFDHKQFFDGVKARIDPTLNQEQVDGLEFLLRRFETGPRWTDIRHIAYALATIFHETAGSFQPVEEGYYLGKRAKAFQRKLRYYPYFGRGFVQLTWKKNYIQAGKTLGIDLISDPSLALEPDHAFDILTEGLFRGWFGGKLTTYINDKETDYVEARRCVNVLDKAGLIAGYATSFEKILRTSAAVPSADGSAESSGESGQNALTGGRSLADGSNPGPDGQPPIPPDANVQIADNIINAADPPAPPPEDKTLAAPVKDGATAASVKTTIAGIVVPGFIVTAIASLKQLIADGYISASDVGSTVLNFIKENQKYVFLLIGLLIVLLIVKKIIKIITFWLEMISHMVPTFNNITVVPGDSTPKAKWWQIWR
jgi:hypothetical protein